jgi:cytochrome c-type biogenesis protein CcsB
MYEFTLVVGLMATVAWLATLVKMPQLRYLGLFVMMPVLLVMFLAGTLYTKASKLVPALQSYWLAIHVSSVAVAEGILLTSAAITGMYLVRARFERHAEAGTAPARFAGLGSRLPAAAALDKAAYRTVAFAFPIYTAGVIFGAIWAEAAWGRYWGWDPKETWAFIAWVIYATYLHARATAGWKGNRAAYINLLGFGAMTFNFFVVNIVISGLHSYAGLS